jgi:hypothetical protein
MNIILNSNTRDGLLSPKEGERAVSCPEVGCWVTAVRLSGGKPEAATLHAGLQRELRISDLPFTTFQTLEFLQTFLSSCFRTQTCDFFNFSTGNFTIRTNNKNEIFTGINFSQLILAEKTKINDSGRAPPDLFLSLQKVAHKPT